MRDARTRRGTAGAVIAAVFVLLVVLSPTILFGQSHSVIDFVPIGASLLGVGLLVRWRSGARGANGRPRETTRGTLWWRTFGASLAIIGAVILVIAVGFTALYLAGWGRGY
jgi:hypothetical protein